MLATSRTRLGVAGETVAAHSRCANESSTAVSAEGLILGLEMSERLLVERRSTVEIHRRRQCHLEICDVVELGDCVADGVAEDVTTGGALLADEVHVPSGHLHTTDRITEAESHHSACYIDEHAYVLVAQHRRERRVRARLPGNRADVHSAEATVDADCRWPLGVVAVTRHRGLEVSLLQGA